MSTSVLATKVGSTSDVVTVSSDGTYLVRVIGEDTKTPTEDQVKIVKNSGFSYWYTKQKEAATIDYNLGSTSPTG